MIRKYEKPEIRPAELYLEGFICSSDEMNYFMFADEYDTYNEEDVVF